MAAVPQSDHPDSRGQINIYSARAWSSDSGEPVRARGPAERQSPTLPFATARGVRTDPNARPTNAPSPVPGTTDRPGRDIEEAFYMAFRASPVAIVITDLRDGQFLEVNDQFLRLFGFDRGDVLGHTSVDLGMWADIERRQNVRERLREFGSIRDEEVSVRTRIGEIRRTLLSAEAVDLRNQRVIITSLVDMTELGAVREAKARLGAIVEGSADGILLLDRRGTILDANPAGAMLLGARDPGALRGINLGELLPARELEKARSYLRALLHDEPVAEPLETFVQGKDGAQRFMQVRSRVIREDGVDPYVQVIARDVTAEKGYQQRLLESERRASMAQVAAFVAHEVRTPLTNIALLTSSLERTVEDPHTLEKLEKIHEQRRLATNIVAELVAITRSDEVRRIETDVRGVVEAAADQAIAFRQGKVSLVKELPKDPVMANVDPLRLQHALVNILKNAFQAASKGSVTVRLETTPDSFSVGVTDTGAGMDEEVRTQLFQPFFTTKPRGEGVGLGLVLAKAVVDAHHGSIAVATEPGTGSTFTIRLPRPMEPTPPGSRKTKS